jgi:uncharacterized protein YrrD
MNRCSGFFILLALGVGPHLQYRAIAANQYPLTADEIRRNRLSHIIRMDLEDDHGESAGKVKDFILGRRSGIVRFGIVVSGGTLGLGRSFKVVPARTLNSNTAKRSALGLSVSRFKLAEAFDFKRRDLASLQKPGRVRELDVIFGLARPNQSAGLASSVTNPVLELPGSGQVRGLQNILEDKLELATELIGDVVVNRKQQKIGKISDLLVDPSGHRPAIAIISPGHLLKHGKSYAVPLQRLGSIGNKQLSIDADLITFNSAPFFDYRAWENGTLTDTVCRYDDAEKADTARNLATGNVTQPTPLQRPESITDLRITQQIRQEISSAPGLSLTARNVQIVTILGKVTLRGSVLTSGEKDRILGMARQIAGAAEVTDELEVKK